MLIQIPINDIALFTEHATSVENRDTFSFGDSLAKVTGDSVHASGTCPTGSIYLPCRTCPRVPHKFHYSSSSVEVDDKDSCRDFRQKTFSNSAQIISVFDVFSP